MPDGQARRGRVPAAAPLDTGVCAPLATEQVVVSGLLPAALHTYRRISRGTSRIVVHAAAARAQTDIKRLRGVRQSARKRAVGGLPRKVTPHARRPHAGETGPTHARNWHATEQNRPPRAQLVNRLVKLPRAHLPLPPSAAVEIAAWGVAGCILFELHGILAECAPFLVDYHEHARAPAFLAAVDIHVALTLSPA